MEILFNSQRKLVILMKFTFYLSAYLFFCLKISNFNAFSIKLLLKNSNCYKKLVKYCKIKTTFWDYIRNFRFTVYKFCKILSLKKTFCKEFALKIIPLERNCKELISGLGEKNTYFNWTYQQN